MVTAWLLGYMYTRGHCFLSGGTTEFLVADFLPDVVFEYWSLDEITLDHV